MVDANGESGHSTRNEIFPTISETLTIIDTPSKPCMPKMMKTGQKVIKRKRKVVRKQVKFTCDADKMEISEVDKLLSCHGQSVKLIEPNITAQSVNHDHDFDDFLCGTCQDSEQDDTDMPDSDHSPEVADQNSHSNDQSESEHKATEIDWSSVVKQIKDAEDLKSTNHGTTNIREYLHALNKPAYHHTSYHIAPPNGINLLVSANEPGQVMHVEKGYVWAQVPCAVDSGACAHVSPPDIFGKLEQKEAITKGKYFAADGSPIDEFGRLSVNAILEGGTELATTFDIVKITRPLLSVNQMVANGHNVVFGRDSSYIQVGGSKKRIYLRPEGKLYMLDLWVKLPIEVARTSPFVRQVSQA